MRDDAVKEFLVESRENLDRLDVDLITLEQDPRNAACLGTVFRTIHTMKGTCGLLAFSRLEAVSRVGENLLSKMRDGTLVLNGDIAAALLRMVEAIRQILVHIEATGAEPPGDDRELIAELTRLRGRVAAADLLAAATGDSTAAIMSALELRSAEPRRLRDDRRASASTLVDTSIRIDVAALDNLMSLVGELALARDQILQCSVSPADTSLGGATQRLNIVTSALQDSIMKMRLQPIGNVWSKLPHLVRHLATQMGKEVNLQMEGKATDLDKTIIEAIKDPLTHIVRNAVDHGIETPTVRLLLGKPAAGHLRLRAYHEGDQINIEIADDGAGIDPVLVRASAVRKGLVSAEAAVIMSDYEAVSLVFRRGFSTVDQVTELSGRGVGMDVVKTNIEKIGGEVDIQSRVGRGTTLRIRIPQTLTSMAADQRKPGGSFEH